MYGWRELVAQLPARSLSRTGRQGVDMSDDPHASESKPLQRFDVPADVVGRDIHQDAVRRARFALERVG